ncbi:unnamed protein product [Bursaphelenchus xylophilus]|uniref:(pine wood nematode) hypothetical protein n=1 Tax=Bursaphelenchus xylophilus TaxID=6326 RepID=A0A1I7RZ01_BURXY|nr:unnamed protein product [Bursaphelenchus xylophilus]CAG9106989.1 unnamed protein product [Bursaphelenchus xylophilus]
MQAKSLMIETRDRQRYMVPFDVIKIAGSLKHLVDEDDCDTDPCALPQIRSEVFKKVLEWCLLREGIPEPEYDPKTRPNLRLYPKALSKSEENFFEMSPEDLAELSTAADYLGIRSLQLYIHFFSRFY